MSQLVRLATFVALIFSAAVGGCSLVRTPIVDNPEMDAGMDAGRDVGMLDVPDGADTGIDSGTDTGMIDTGMTDADMTDTGVDAGTDAGMRDTGVDSGMPDTGVDSGMPDTGVDAGMPDTGVDAGMPDTGVDAPPPLPSCDDLYGFLEGYMACPAATGRCAFYVDRTGMNEQCDTICEMIMGATCTAAFSTSGTCTGTGSQACNSTGNDRICVCDPP